MVEVNFDITFLYKIKHVNLANVAIAYSQSV